MNFLKLSECVFHFMSTKTLLVLHLNENIIGDQFVLYELSSLFALVAIQDNKNILSYIILQEVEHAPLS